MIIDRRHAEKLFMTKIEVLETEWPEVYSSLGIKVPDVPHSSKGSTLTILCRMSPFPAVSDSLGVDTDN